ncbi:MAG: DUF885 domain-containing protein [Burkholderiales bacterium]|nr:DUF885 domain-containing protein [Burkholderiales bacterium]
MKRVLKWIGIVLLTVILLAAGLAAHTWYAKPLSINWYYTRVFAQFALTNNELLTQLRMLEGIGLRGHNAKLDDASPAETERTAARSRAFLDTLRSYDASGFTGQDKLSYDILDYFLASQVKGEPWRYHNFPVNQLFGIQSELPNMMTTAQQVNDATDAEHYLARLAQYPRKFDEIIESMKYREERKILPPRFVVEKVGDQIREFIATGAPNNALVTTFRDKLDKIPADKMDAARKAELVKQAEDSVAANVLPAYTKLGAYMDSLKNKATENRGAWSLPDGDKYYEYVIEAQTTTRMKADELHALGLAEVARIGAEMDAILDAAGYKQPTRAARIAALAKSPSQVYPATDAGRAQVLKDYQAIIDEIDAKVETMVTRRPAARVVVERVPAMAEKSSAFAYYNGPAMDGSKPGVFFVNLRKPDEIAKFGMRTLAYHEAIPGHHLQIATAHELKDLPIFRRLVPFTAYSEGWALYAEKLAWELGYQKDPFDNLGRLQAEMFRAVRLVVDTGIHSQRWTREQAIEYMIANTGMPEVEVVAEIERYFVNPGQALAYKVGMIKILQLREKAKAALGQKFDLREFHDAVLGNGAMPLEVLERVIDDYVARKKAG